MIDMLYTLNIYNFYLKVYMLDKAFYKEKIKDNDPDEKNNTSRIAAFSGLAPVDFSSIISHCVLYNFALIE